jgi:hypothetical protein
VRRMAGFLRRCTAKPGASERRHASMKWNRRSAPCALDVPIPRDVLQTRQTVARDSEMCDLWRESPARSAVTSASARLISWGRFHARRNQDVYVRFCVVRGHARADELDSGRPVASTDIRELVCARRHAHVVSHERACAGRAQQKVPTQETDEEVLLRR